MRALLIASAMALSLPASAAIFTVTFDSSEAIPGNNDFQTDLSDLGLTRFASTGATITLDEPSLLTFEYLGSESRFNDTFTWGDATYTETGNSNNFDDPINFGLDLLFDGGEFEAQFFDGVLVAPVGSAGFAIFIPVEADGTYSSDTLVFGYDDRPNSPDDNHDDIIVRVTARSENIVVPEAGNLGLMLLGMGLLGFAASRRR